MSEKAKELYRKGRDFWRAGQIPEAQKAFQRAIELDPTLPHPHYDLAVLMDQHGGKQTQVLEHYQRFVILATNNPELEPQVEQARQRVEGTQIASQVGILTTEVSTPKFRATRLVKQHLAKQEYIEEGAPKILVPVWQVRYQGPGRTRKGQEAGYLYISATDGTLLQVTKGVLRFTPLEEAKLKLATGFESKARFVHRPLSQLTQKPVQPAIGREAIAAKLGNVLKVQPIEIDLLLLPLWQFTAVHDKTKKKRLVFVDTTFGYFVTRPGMQPAPKRSRLIWRRLRNIALLLLLIFVSLFALSQIDRIMNERESISELPPPPEATFSDDFQGGLGLTWKTGDGGSWQAIDGLLAVYAEPWPGVSRNWKTLVEGGPDPDETYICSECSIEVTVTLPLTDTAAGAGVVFGYASASDFYQFVVSGVDSDEPMWTVERGVPDSELGVRIVPLQPPANLTATLAVYRPFALQVEVATQEIEGAGSETVARCYVNGTLVGIVTLPQYSEGQVGVVVATPAGQGGLALFDDFAVFRIDTEDIEPEQTTTPEN